MSLLDQNRIRLCPLDKVGEDEFDAITNAIDLCVVCCMGQTDWRIVDRDHSLAGERKLDRIAADAGKGIDNSVASVCSGCR